MRLRLSLAIVAAVAVCGAVACSGPAADAIQRQLPAPPSAPPPERDAALVRAKVWAPTHVEAMNIRQGPSRPDGFAYLAAVRCDWVNKPLRGHSLKFACDVGHHDVVKVKVGESNGEVFSEVAATRLLWALGFGADAMYPVRVTCHGCPPRFGGTLLPDGDRLFDPAVIERSMPGAEFDNDRGWSWDDLKRVDPKQGGASRAERDALTLLAVFLQHTDNKPEQQRLLCLDMPSSKPATVCAHPFLMLDDVGLTFGGANFTNDNLVGSANLHAWSSTPLWQGPSSCVGNLAPSFTGTLSNPVIDDEGRRLLAALLKRLSVAQIRELFAVSRFDVHDRATVHEHVPSIDDWVKAFIHKRDEVATRRCA